ncbi:MAG: PP2C family protein-serine/threonine phosphatase, partial [Gemmataceae bacterium]
MTRFDQIEHACLTDVGVKRSHNQDNYAVQLVGEEEGWIQRGHLFLVADGMGGHAVGEKASEQAAQVIPHIYQKHAQQGPSQAIRKAFVEANATIHSCGQQNREFHGMGTTSTALLLRDDGAWIGHVGDSRCYRIRNGLIEQLSYDHSMVWEIARLQHMDPDEVDEVRANIILRCLGPEPLVEVDVDGPFPIEPGDVYLLCSDGLSGQVTDPEIGAVAGMLPPAEACRFLVDFANLRGGPDNTTVVIVRVGGVPEGGSNGSSKSSPKKARKNRRGSWLALWLPSLLMGIGLAVWATWLVQARMNTPALLAFVFAVPLVLIGMAGWVLQIHREKNKPPVPEEENRPLSGPHRSRPCKIEKPLVDRLYKTLRQMKQFAEER